jgi:hypothetical protein
MMDKKADDYQCVEPGDPHSLPAFARNDLFQKGAMQSLKLGVQKIVQILFGDDLIGFFKFGEFHGRKALKRFDNRLIDEARLVRDRGQRASRRDRDRESHSDGEPAGLASGTFARASARGWLVHLFHGPGVDLFKRDMAHDALRVENNDQVMAGRGKEHMIGPVNADEVTARCFQEESPERLGARKGFELLECHELTRLLCRLVETVHEFFGRLAGASLNLCAHLLVEFVKFFLRGGLTDGTNLGPLMVGAEEAVIWEKVPDFVFKGDFDLVGFLHTSIYDTSLIN